MAHVGGVRGADMAESLELDGDTPSSFLFESRTNGLIIHPSPKTNHSRRRKKKEMTLWPAGERKKERILKIQASLTAHWHDKGADWRGLAHSPAHL